MAFKQVRSQRKALSFNLSELQQATVCLVRGARRAVDDRRHAAMLDLFAGVAASENTQPVDVILMHPELAEHFYDVRREDEFEAPPA